MKRNTIKLALKFVRHKSYDNFLPLPIAIFQLKYLSIDFVIKLSILANQKSNSYDLTFVIIDCLRKMVYYKSVMVSINISGLTKVIFNVVVQSYNIYNLIIIDRSLLFIFKFWSSSNFFFSIQQKHSITFYSQIDGQILKLNSIIEACFQVFFHNKQINKARLF